MVSDVQADGVENDPVGTSAPDISLGHAQSMAAAADASFPFSTHSIAADTTAHAPQGNAQFTKDSPKLWRSMDVVFSPGALVPDAAGVLHEISRAIQCDVPTDRSSSSASYTQRATTEYMILAPSMIWP